MPGLPGLIGSARSVSRTYVGRWKDGKYDGHGTLETDTTKYVGEFKDGVSHGVGLLIFVAACITEFGVWEHEEPYMVIRYRESGQIEGYFLNRQFYRGDNVPAAVQERLARAREASPSQKVTLCGFEHQVIPKSRKPKKVSAPSKVVGTGTGFVINGNGYIVTNSHVVRGCASVVTVKDSEKIATKVIFDDSRNDLALLKVDKRSKVFATFRGGRGIRTAEDILALGYPFQSLLSDDLKITKGMVNSLAGLENDTRMMQISAPVQPGNSGGPLLDHAGNVVGVVTSRMNAVKMAKHTGKIPQNVNFALKASLVRDMLDVKSIDYEMASSKKELKAVDIFDRARKYTVLVECLQ